MNAGTNSGTGSTPGNKLAYTIGATVSGLSSGTLVLQNNGADTLSVATNGTATFATALASGAIYAVTVSTQPSGQSCKVDTGSGTVAAANVTGVTVSCRVNNLWAWMAGDNTAPASPSIYGTQTLASAANVLGARVDATTWSDASGNLWLFGGTDYNFNVQWNDLWKYNISTRQWTWVKGDNTTGSAGVYGTLGTASPSNLPGARRGSMSWRDNAGNLWLMGGSGFAASGSGYLNDLWKYNTSTNEWTWMGGTNAVEGTGVYGTRGVASPANAPGARGYAARWSDSAGNLWLMGGEGYGESGSSGNLNDLWKYSTATNQWTWIGGAKTTGTSGVYGSKGVTSSTNVPGARSALASWSDSAGNLWLMGGEGNAASGSGLLNDLWKYNIANNQWTWMSGANTADGAATFGTQGTTGVANVPGARSFFNSWSDTFGNLWLFGGTGHAGSAAIGMLSDLWKYNISTNQWTWVSGTTAFDSAGIYGTLGTTNSANAPGAREGAAAWTDSAGDFWLFGGDSTDVNSTREGMNDLWRYLP